MRFFHKFPGRPGFPIGTFIIGWVVGMLISYLIRHHL